jgi:hypothetical protein
LKEGWIAQGVTQSWDPTAGLALNVLVEDGSRLPSRFIENK